MRKMSHFKIFPCLRRGTQKHWHSRRRNTTMYTLLWDLNNIETQIRKDRPGPRPAPLRLLRTCGAGTGEGRKERCPRESRVRDAAVSEPEPPLVLAPRTASSYTERRTTAK